MKTSLVIALTVAFVLGAGGALAAMNKACRIHEMDLPAGEARDRFIMLGIVRGVLRYEALTR